MPRATHALLPCRTTAGVFDRCVVHSHQNGSGLFSQKKKKNCRHFSTQHTPPPKRQQTCLRCEWRQTTPARESISTVPLGSLPEEESHQGISLTHYLPTKQPPPVLSSFSATQTKGRRKGRRKKNKHKRTYARRKKKAKTKQREILRSLRGVIDRPCRLSLRNSSGSCNSSRSSSRSCSSSTSK